MEILIEHQSTRIAVAPKRRCVVDHRGTVAWDVARSPSSR